MGTYEGFMETEFGGVRSHFCKILHLENGQKVNNLNQYISIIIDIDEKWFLIFEHTINYLSFGYGHLPQLEYHFYCSASFFLLFFSSFNAIYF